MKRLSYIFLIGLFIAAFTSVPMAVSAQEYSIKKMTPAVQSALENRRDRYENIQFEKAKGNLGENNRGYVEVLGGGDSVKALADAENKDRKIIYQTIAEQNDLTKAIEIIEKVFAQVQRDKASAGEKIQMEDGKWVTKG
ncbi:MAG: YdbL family protein [Candidatus Omnitrophica bacterium]|nr:YdbL family protein [Candidatus Omnitrophota bacterium]